MEDTPINATRNWWGSWIGSYINGKIWDSNDDERLISVIYFPAKANNESFLEGKGEGGGLGWGTSILYLADSDNVA